jgi:hypothetical protein
MRTCKNLYHSLRQGMYSLSDEKHTGRRFGPNKRKVFAAVKKQLPKTVRKLSAATNGS